MAHGWCDAPLTLSIVARPEAMMRAQARVQGLPQPLHALCIGLSEPYKQWGAGNFAALAAELASTGHGVLLVGGPAERDMAQAILQRLDAALPTGVLAFTDGAVADTVTVMSLVRACLGNDAGGVQIAAAVGTPTWVVLGPRALLNQDPQTLHNLTAANLADIRSQDVARVALEHVARRSLGA